MGYTLCGYHGILVYHKHWLLNACAFNLWKQRLPNNSKHVLIIKGLRQGRRGENNMMQGLEASSQLESSFLVHHFELCTFEIACACVHPAYS